MKKGNSKQVMAGIRGEMSKRNKAAGIVIANAAKRHTPVGTPESTGIEGYRGGRLRDSVGPKADADGVLVGTNVRYGPYVHNGTYDYKNEEWTEAELAELDAIADEVGDGKKGMPPRPFLVNGMVESGPALERIYGG